MEFSVTLPAQWRQAVRRIGRTVVDGILPPRCLACGTVVGEPDALCGRWRRRTGGELLDGVDLILPVPLHWPRLFARRYNQAALLAHAIHAAGGPPVAPDWLVRRRRTPSQGRLGAAGRARNVRGAFLLRPGHSVAGKRLVIVDDVLTSGATVEECARMLRRE